MSNEEDQAGLSDWTSSVAPWWLRFPRNTTGEIASANIHRRRDGPSNAYLIPALERWLADPEHRTIEAGEADPQEAAERLAWSD